MGLSVPGNTGNKLYCHIPFTASKKALPGILSDSPKEDNACPLSLTLMNFS
jgi:hypothetical protein